MARPEDDEARLDTCRQEHAALAARLAGIGFIWPGTIQWRMMTCGRDYCACRTDPRARHGPYPYWTTKKNQKTVSRLLTAEEAALYEEWIANRRELEEILAKMKRLSKQAAAPALRSKLRKEAPPATSD
jgi:hypothetical protein